MDGADWFVSCLCVYWAVGTISECEVLLIRHDWLASRGQVVMS